MKNISLFAFIVLMLASCGADKSDPAVRLAKLKDQKSQLEAQIATLEKQVNAGKPAERRIRTVGLTEVSTAPFRHYIDLQGKVDAGESVLATSRMPGTLKKVYVQNGDAVRRGQLLAEIDDAVMLKSLAEVEGS